MFRADRFMPAGHIAPFAFCFFSFYTDRIRSENTKNNGNEWLRIYKSRINSLNIRSEIIWRKKKTRWVRKFNLEKLCKIITEEFELLVQLKYLFDLTWFSKLFCCNRSVKSSNFRIFAIRVIKKWNCLLFCVSSSVFSSFSKAQNRSRIYAQNKSGDCVRTYPRLQKTPEHKLPYILT